MLVRLMLPYAGHGTPGGLLSPDCIRQVKWREVKLMTIELTADELHMIMCDEVGDLSAPTPITC